MRPYNLIFVGLCLFFTACKTKKNLRKPIENKPKEHIEKTDISFSKSILKKEKEYIDSILATKKEPFKKSNYGFYYSISRKKITTLDRDKKMPKHGDTIYYNFEVKTLEGDYLYKRLEDGMLTYVFEKEVVFPAFAEAIKMLKEGEEGLFIFPSNRAYGYEGDGNKINRAMPIECWINTIKIESK